MAVDTAAKRFSMMGLGVQPSHVLIGVPDGLNMDTAGQRQAMLLLYSGITAISVTWTTQGLIMLAGATTSAFAFEATMLAALGTVKARLYNQTDGSAVANSEVVTMAATKTRVRSSAITITAAKEYVAQFGKTGGDNGTGYGAVMVPA